MIQYSGWFCGWYSEYRKGRIATCNICTHANSGDGVGYLRDLTLESARWFPSRATDSRRPRGTHPEDHEKVCTQPRGKREQKKMGKLAKGHRWLVQFSGRTKPSAGGNCGDRAICGGRPDTAQRNVRPPTPPTDRRSFVLQELSTTQPRANPERRPAPTPTQGRRR